MSLPPPVPELLQSPTLQRLGWTLLHFGWQGALTGAGLAMALAALRRRSANARYLVCLGAVIVSMALPVVTFTLLAGKVHLRPGQAPAASVAVGPSRPAPAAEAPPAAASFRSAGQAPPDPRVIRPAALRIEPALPWVAVVWATGVVCLSVRLFLGWLQLDRLRRGGAPVADARLQMLAAAMARRLGVRQAVSLLQSTVVEAPALIGWLRPVILLPVGMLAGLSSAQVEMILAHELAHVRRRDFPVNLAVTLFETLGFYHPVVWWMGARLRQERENACDDLAIEACGDDRLGYARTLATIEAMRGASGRLAVAAASGSLLGRVRRILRVEAPRARAHGAWRLAGLLAIAGVLAFTLGETPYAARVIARSPSVEMRTAQVTVLDEAGKPVAGATVTPDGLHPRPPGSGHYRWDNDRFGSPVAAKTNAAGVATVSYPRFTVERISTGSISFRVEHPDYVGVRPIYYPVIEKAGQPKPVVLQRGVMVRVSGHFPGSPDHVPIYPQAATPLFGWTPSPADWKEVGAETRETRRMPSGRTYLRLAHMGRDGAIYLSDTTLLQAAAGETYTLDLELKPPAQFVGRLDDSVPRPVKNGHISAHVYSASPDEDAKCVTWEDSSRVAEDGTFSFAALPVGTVEITAMCEGFVSSSPPRPGGFAVVSYPQPFGLTGGETTHAEVKMEAAAVCEVTLTDAAGKPLSGVEVGFSPNVRLTPSFSTRFCSEGISSSTILAHWRDKGTPPPFVERKNQFAATSDARGVAVIRNLPARGQSALGVLSDQYELPTRTKLNGETRVDLAPGKTQTVRLRLVPKGATPMKDDPKAPEPGHTSPPGPASSEAALAVRPAPGKLSGTVTDAIGRPLDGVTVDAWTQTPGNVTVTDGAGHFSLEGLESWRVIEVRFSKDSYCPRLVSSQPLGDLDQPLSLARNTVLEGTVTGPDGRPAADALVRANQGPKQSGDELVREIWTEDHADAHGAYRLLLQDDQYEIVATDALGNVSRIPKVEVLSGQTRRLEIGLQPGVLFRARVIDSATGAPVAGVRLADRQHPGEDGVSGTDGTLNIRGLAAGPVEFDVVGEGLSRWWVDKASPPGGAFRRDFERLKFNLKGGMAPVTITVERGVRLRGQVIDPAGKPVAGATVSSALVGTGNSLSGDTGFDVSTGADGAFDLRLPASDGAECCLIAHDGKYGEWRRWANAVSSGIRTEPGQNIEGLLLKLHLASAVEGVVTNEEGAPVVGRAVWSFPADGMENRTYEPQGVTDDLGHFRLDHLRSGKQLIEVEPARLHAVEPYGPGIRPVNLTEGTVMKGIDLQVSAGKSNPTK